MARRRIRALGSMPSTEPRRRRGGRPSRNVHHGARIGDAPVRLPTGAARWHGRDLRPGSGPSWPAPTRAGVSSSRSSTGWRPCWRHPRSSGIARDGRLGRGLEPPPGHGSPVRQHRCHLALPRGGGRAHRRPGPGGPPDAAAHPAPIRGPWADGMWSPRPLASSRRGPIAQLAQSAINHWSCAVPGRHEAIDDPLPPPSDVLPPIRLTVDEGVGRPMTVPRPDLQAERHRFLERHTQEVPRLLMPPPPLMSVAPPRMVIDRNVTLIPRFTVTTVPLSSHHGLTGRLPPSRMGLPEVAVRMPVMVRFLLSVVMPTQVPRTVSRWPALAALWACWRLFLVTPVSRFFTRQAVGEAAAAGAAARSVAARARAPMVAMARRRPERVDIGDPPSVLPAVARRCTRRARVRPVDGAGRADPDATPEGRGGRKGRMAPSVAGAAASATPSQSQGRESAIRRHSKDRR
jgi:hypothetical protein